MFFMLLQQIRIVYIILRQQVGATPQTQYLETVLESSTRCRSSSISATETLVAILSATTWQQPGVQEGNNFCLKVLQHVCHRDSGRNIVCNYLAAPWVQEGNNFCLKVLQHVCHRDSGRNIVRNYLAAPWGPGR
jgi:hypothetical protein